LNSELVDLKALNSELTTSCSEKDEKISELYDNLNRVTADSMLLESNQDSEVIKLQKAYEEMSKLNDSLSIGNERIKKLEQDLEINIKSNEELIVSLNTSDGMCQTLKNSLEAMRHSGNERSELIEQKDVECKQLHSIIVQLRQQLQSNQSNEVQFKILQNDLSNKTNDLNASISREESLNNQIKSMQTNISDLTRLHEVQASDVSNFKESLELKEKECLQLKEVINQLRHQLQNKIVQKGNTTEDYKIKYDSLLIEFNNLSKTLSENSLLLTEKDKKYNELIENNKSFSTQSDESNQLVIKLRADYDSINHQLHDNFKEIESLKANELLLLNEKKGFEIKIISYEETLSELNKKLDELSLRPKESQADPKSQMLVQQLQK
jgi:chromosome segregation ATPase